MTLLQDIMTGPDAKTLLHLYLAFDGDTKKFIASSVPGNICTHNANPIDWNNSSQIKFDSWAQFGTISQT